MRGIILQAQKKSIYTKPYLLSSAFFTTTHCRCPSEWDETTGKTQMIYSFLWPWSQYSSLPPPGCSSESIHTALVKYRCLGSTPVLIHWAFAPVVFSLAGTFGYKAMAKAHCSTDPKTPLKVKAVKRENQTTGSSEISRRGQTITTERSFYSRHWMNCFARINEFHLGQESSFNYQHFTYGENSHVEKSFPSAVLYNTLYTHTL